MVSTLFRCRTCWEAGGAAGVGGRRGVNSVFLTRKDSLAFFQEESCSSSTLFVLVSCSCGGWGAGSFVQANVLQPSFGTISGIASALGALVFDSFAL